MLSHLSIRNMAIIESLELDFFAGMTVLAGETGAGKSIIIDAISLLLGDRASTELIRHDEEKATVEAVFSVKPGAEFVKFFEDNDIYFEDEIVIKRVVKRGGGSQARVNGSMVTVGQLKAIGNMLVDIHVQHDSFRLFQPDATYGLIDNLGDADVISTRNKEYQEALARYQESRNRYGDFLKKADGISARLDFIKFQKDEIEKAKLVPGELEDLEAQQKVMASSDELHTILNNVLGVTNGDGAAMEQLYLARGNIESLHRIDSKFEPLVAQINDIYYGLEGFVDVISSEITNLTFEPHELDEIETRIAKLRGLERKYKMDISDIIDYYDEIVDEIAQFEDSEGYKADLLAAVRVAHDDVVAKGTSLNDERVLIVDKIKADLVKELGDLKLPNANFDVKFESLISGDFLSTNYSSKGLYEIELMLSTNKGEPLKPLNKVASGGELSRIMLALKSILSRGQLIGTIIFDEIDTGVSGHVGASIGAKMKEVASTKQILCITHLPQVASMADYHVHVSKDDSLGRTVTSVSYLNDEERAHEIAKMLSDDTVSESALLNARELLSR